MQEKFEITKELRTHCSEFLSGFANYEKCLKDLRDESKKDFTEEEVNEILNVLGTFRLREVFGIVERFKIEVTKLKPQSSDQQPGDNEQQAG